MNLEAALFALVALMVLIIIGSFVEWETAGHLAVAMLFIGIGFYQSNRIRKILVIIGISLIGLIVTIHFNIGVGLITVGVVIQVIGFFLMLFAQTPIGIKDHDFFKQHFTLHEKHSPPTFQGPNHPTYYPGGIWMIISGMFIQLTGVYISLLS